VPPPRMCVGEQVVRVGSPFRKARRHTPLSKGFSDHYAIRQREAREGGEDDSRRVTEVFEGSTG
jgi:hypothetical protein